jgi:hypothetical protein
MEPENVTDPAGDKADVTGEVTFKKMDNGYSLFDGEYTMEYKELTPPQTFKFKISFVIK